MRTARLLIACTFLGFFLSAQEGESAEEMVVFLPKEPFFPKSLSFTPSIAPGAFVPPLEEPPLFGEEQLFPGEEWPRFPKGKEVALQRLEGRFRMGRRAISVFCHPRVTFSLRAEGLQHYMTRGPLKKFPLTDEEKLAASFRFAESVAESLQAVPIPLVGNFLVGCIEVGRNLEKTNKKIKKNYRLHLNYSDKTLQAAYRESF